MGVGGLSTSIVLRSNASTERQQVQCGGAVAVFAKPGVNTQAAHSDAMFLLEESLDAPPSDATLAHPPSQVRGMLVEILARQRSEVRPRRLLFWRHTCQESLHCRFLHDQAMPSGKESFEHVAGTDAFIALLTARLEPSRRAASP